MYDFRVSNDDAVDKTLVGWVAAGLDKRRGKTQDGLAKALGVSQPRISEILNRKRRIQVDEIPKIAEYIEQPPPAGWMHLNHQNSDPQPKNKAKIRFGLHEEPNLVWVLVFRDDKLVDQFEADATELDILKQQVIRAIQTLPKPK